METRGITSDSERERFETEGFDFSCDLAARVCVGRIEKRTVDGRFKERDVGCVIGLCFLLVLPVLQ